MPPVAPNPDSLQNAEALKLPHDIAGPVSYLPYPLPVLIGAAIIGLILLGLIVWAFIAWRIRAKRRPPTAQEQALAQLAKCRATAETTSSYDFIIIVSDVLRGFLEHEYKLPATTQTSFEFLQTAYKSGIFGEARLETLSRFLGKADAIKFAREQGTLQDNLDLVQIAEDMVKGGIKDAVAP